MITDDDKAFLLSFEECSLGAKCWTHAAHVRMGWLVLETSSSFDGAWSGQLYTARLYIAYCLMLLHIYPVTVQLQACTSHNPKVVSSNLTPATNLKA
jgi:hypothetical protein